MSGSPVPIRLGNLDQRLGDAVTAGYRVIWLAGPRGSGKTTFLQRWCGSREIPFLQVEPVTATPEILSRRARAILTGEQVESGRGGFEDFLSLFRTTEIAGPLALDELTELRRLSYFPGISDPLEHALAVMVRRRAPVIATSRFPHWLMSQNDPPYVSKRMLRMEMPPPTAKDLEAAGVPEPSAILRATGGVLMHVDALATATAASDSLHEALFGLMKPGGRSEIEARASLAELLHRARGYGACKAVLTVLAGEEPLTLSEIARRLDRTPGSTRDYLRWLEEVDLIQRERIASEGGTLRKMFRFRDPMLRLWMRLYAGGSPAVPGDQRFESEIARHLERSQSTVPSAPEAIAEPAPIELPEAASYDIDELVEID